jgi:glutaredoxin
VAKDCPHSQKARDDLERRPGLEVRVLDVTTNKDALRRFYSLADQHRVTAGLPLLHACRQVVVGYDQASRTAVRYDDVFTVDVFTREGCTHCADAKSFLRRIEHRYPGFRFFTYDVVADRNNRLRFEQLNREHGIRVPGVPSFRIGGEFVVGYTGDATTGAKLQKILNDVTVPCTVRLQPRGSSDRPPLTSDDSRTGLFRQGWPGFPLAQAFAAEEPSEQVLSSPPPPRSDAVDDSSQPPPRPEPDGDQQLSVASPRTVDQDSEVEVPLFGRLDAQQMGMPLFTILIGLVDGFNPCAMWVLLFLLSILISLHDRRKILAVAGTFVVVSGGVYFAFMAAWLNVFHLIGFRRWSEVALALIAVVIGGINIKDFFAFKRGVSLSIPESAKPGIYARVRGIVTAQNLTAAIAGAVALAVLINFVELLCTAGLPALYTKVLTMQQYPAWVELSYLGLYNLAYMFDDGVMVGIAVATLGRHKLQEREGRWLKLFSGCAILALGPMLLFAPKWLV